MRTNKFQRFILKLIRLPAYVFGVDDMHNQFTIGRQFGYTQGKLQAKTNFAVLPLPFTESQLLGREYGSFITPHGFATVFGECNVPAPGPNGYEQRAYYCSREQLNMGDKTDPVCHRPLRFDNPANSDALVPVILTVLR